MDDREDLGADARRRDAIFIASVALVGCAIALVDTFSVVHDRARAGRPLPFWEPLVWETTSVAVLTALSPAIMAFTRRVPPLAAPWGRVMLGHFIAAVIFSLIHVTAMGILRWAIYAAVGDVYAPLSPLSEFPYEFRKDLLVYFAVVAIYVIWRRMAPSASAAALPSDAIEIRDGARRHFLPSTEVAWIEAAGNYVELHRGGTSILHRASLSEMERRLKHVGFVRIHRARLVRRAAIKEVKSKPSGDYVVRLVDGRELAGSRRYRRPLLEP